MRVYFLKSQRLGFSKWEEKDLQLAVDLWGDIEVTKLIDTRGKLTNEQVGERLLKEIEQDKKYTVQYWPIFLLENGEHAGCCGLKPYDIENGMYEIGFHIKKAFWGMNLAYESACAVIKYAFGNMNVKALFAGHNPNNHASKHLLEKLGFKYTHDEYYPPTGLNHPSYLLYREDYKRRWAE